jgi:diphthamide synthase (EF-2-diphthine--ammonia ligase)
MYQSVGTTLIPLLAESMRLPLYTQVIRGKPLRVGGTYGSRTPGGFGGGGRDEEREDENEKDDEVKGDESGEGDETEDLEVLLRTVKVSLYIQAFLLVLKNQDQTSSRGRCRDR